MAGNNDELDMMVNAMFLVILMGLMSSVFEPSAPSVPPIPEPPGPPAPPPAPPPGQANLYGQVKDATTGSVLELVSVSANGQQAPTDDLGVYIISGLQPGEYIVEFSKDEYGTASTPLTLVEGNNRCDIRLQLVIPTPPGPTGLRYVSNVRASNGQGCTYGGVYAEVDVENIGSSPQSCSPVMHVSTSYVSHTVSMGTKTIQPSQIATFTANWCWPYGPLDPGDFWRGDYIESEAGAISFEYGREVYFVSFLMPSRIPAGLEFWATQTMQLRYAPDTIYIATLQLWKSGLPQSGSTPMCVASHGLIGGAAYGYHDWDIELVGIGAYTIQGIWTYMGPLAEKVNIPSKADMMFGTPVGDTPSYKGIPLPPGTYDVVHTLWTWRIVGSDEVSDETRLWTRRKVGEVEIV